MSTGTNKLSPRDAPLILVIDDDPDLINLLVHQLHSAGVQTTSAEDGMTGITIAQKYRPQAILLDIHMPGMDGFEVCAALKSHPSTEEIPIIFITSSEPTDELLETCFEAGANDFLSKPIRSAELQGRIRVVLRENEIRESYRRLALRDPLTQLANRRQFIHDVTHAIEVSRQEGTESTLFIGEIDEYNAVLERVGHHFSDEILVTFSRLLQRFISPDCKAGRISKGTIAAVLTNSTKQRAIDVCTRLRQTFAAVAFDAETSPKHFTAGFGIAAYHGDPSDFNVDDFLGQADYALSKAKELGRNKAVAFWELQPDEYPDAPRHPRHSRSSPRPQSNDPDIGVAHEKQADKPAVEQTD